MRDGVSVLAAGAEGLTCGLTQAVKKNISSGIKNRFISRMGNPTCRIVSPLPREL